MIDHSINVHDSLADGGEEAKSATIVNIYLYSLDTIYYLTLCDCDDLVRGERERAREKTRKERGKQYQGRSEPSRNRDYLPTSGL